ncbi:RNase H domain-containing protein [Trichonephila clavipes]|nr:RNase H domain-containing protein [Trichonephila clavipes]
MGNRLRKLKALRGEKKVSDGKTIGGKGRLTDAIISKLTTFYGNAIRANSHNVNEMRQAVWAVWAHTSSTDDEPKHWFCPKGKNSWCKYNVSVHNNTVNEFSHKNTLPKAVSEVIKPVFKDLSHLKLLRRCLGGKLKMLMSLNSLIWKYSPKLIGSGINITKIAAFIAACEYNDGSPERPSQFLLAKSFLDYPANTTPHKSLNSSRGVISEPDLLTTSDAEILEGFFDQGVIQDRRKTIKKDSNIIPTKHLILTFNNSKLPTTVKDGYLNCKIRAYIPNPLRCFKCQRFGHSQITCRGQMTCSRCASVGHSSTDCSLEQKCVNCTQSHPSDSKLCSKWKTEKEIQAIKTNRNITYLEARELIVPQLSQTNAQATKPSTVTTTTQTDENITKIVCPPLKLLQPLRSVPKPTISSSVPAVTKPSSSTQTQLLPSASFVTVTSLSESQPSIPLIDTALTTSNNLSTTSAFSSSNKTLSSSDVSILPAETCPVVETETSITDTIPFTSQDAKQTLKSRKKRRPKRSITSKIDTQLTPHKPKKSTPLQDTSKEDMLIYDIEEEVESPKKLNSVGEIEKLSEEWWQTEGWKSEEYSRTLTPTHSYFELTPTINNERFCKTLLKLSSVTKSVRHTLLRKVRCCQTPLGGRIEHHYSECIRQSYSLASTTDVLYTDQRATLLWFRTSPVQSLYVNCHQLPLDLRRRKLSLAFYFKILSVPSHPLQNVYMSTSMKRLYDARPSNIRPFMDRMKLHISELDLPNVRIQQRNLFLFQPWNTPRFHYINPFATYSKSTVAPVVFQRVFAYHRSRYSRYSAIYTDGSKRADYVGCGVVIEDIMHGYRLDTSCSIFTAEAVTIYRVLQLIDSNMPLKYCIYTDSMSVLEALENYNDRCHPVVCTILDITSRLYSKGFDIVFCWLPSHVGIIGNEQADSAANSVTTHLPLAVPLSDMKRVIMHNIFLRSGRNHGVSSWITNCTL